MEKLREEFLPRDKESCKLFDYNIMLIGFMGAGKSTVAECMRQAFGMEVIEMDRLIEEQQGMRIPDIFERYGEEYFRNLETKLLIDMQSRKNVIVSCGGGVAMREENVAEMKKNGRVVLLTASPETILERVKGDSGRPLLNGHMNVEFIRNMMETRRPKYEAAADLTVATDGKDTCEICREIVQGLSGQGMLRPVKIRNVTIGDGMPKICVPIVGVTEEEIRRQAEALKDAGADVAEWRSDWYASVFQEEKVSEVLRTLRDILDDMPLLFTFRTQPEGGEKQIDINRYNQLKAFAAETGCVDLIDVELSAGEATVRNLVAAAHKHQVKVIASSHDFEKTPEKGEIIRRLTRMQDLGADVLKIAVMPQSPADVLTLLSATEEMYRLYARKPLITMSMSGKGLISRLSGELFGSALTFGAVGRTSAPGQVDARRLREGLSLLHENL